MDYLIRFAQTHESFRQSEVEALASSSNVRCDVVHYSPDSPFCIIRISQSNGDRLLESTCDTIVRDFAAKSILSKGIYEIWGSGETYEIVHKDVSRRSQHLWEKYRQSSFKFSVDSYCNTRDFPTQKRLINSFSYLGFQGKIKMKDPDAEFAIMEEWQPQLNGEAIDDAKHPEENESVLNPVGKIELRNVYFGRKIGESRRHLKDKHDLKKRPYISTTSMDAELALITANMALAGPGKVFVDPFVGTGGFMVAAAELGALTLGSDIDGRSFRGKGAGMDQGIGANMRKYGLRSLFGDCLTSDLTNTPFRTTLQEAGVQDGRWIDGIISDPPYGVREGLKVLGSRKEPSVSPGETSDVDGHSVTVAADGAYLINGVPAHTLPGYIAPKKPYSFTRMLDDILEFSARTLVDRGRLAFWMPSANENEFGEEEVTVIPAHSQLELKHECVQRFNKWSRRLLVYERIPGPFIGNRQTNGGGSTLQASEPSVAHTADELNPFRKRYFQPIVAKAGTA